MRHYESDCSDGRLCCGQVLCCFINSLFELRGWDLPIEHWRVELHQLLCCILFCCLCNVVLNKLRSWILPSNYRRFKLHTMSRRVVLRNHGPYYSHRCLRSRFLLCFFIDCVFKLSIGNLLFVCIFINFMYFMP